MAGVATHKTDETGWAIADPVERLRRWGTDEVFELPAGGTPTIGASPDNDVRIQDDSGSVSRRHARLTRTTGVWSIHDLESTNGIRQDGERRLAFELAPGVEIGIGEVTLIAESAKLVELQRFLARILGWSADQRADVDRALRAVREMASGRAALVLCGAGDLGPVAERLRRLAIGAGATLCLRVERIPSDFAAVARAARRVMLCASSREDAAEAMALLERVAIVDLPSIGSRIDELDQLILEYAADAVVSLGAPDHGFREHELRWLRDVPFDSHAELDELGRRVVALRSWGVTEGAHRLGISHVALSRWARRRKIPT